MVANLSTFHDLVRVETVLWNRLDAQLQAACDITLARFETMQVIGRVRDCRVQDVADELEIGWSGVSKVVTRIEQAGHCHRIPNPNDARSSLITLTSQGRRVLADARTVAARALDEVFEGLAAADLESLGRILSNVRALSSSSHHMPTVRATVGG